MSGNEKHYDYYMVDGEKVRELINGYDEIAKQRNAILPEAASQVGAIAWTTTRGLGGGGGLLESFVWEETFTHPCQVTIKRRDFFDGKRVVIARGKGNTKEGREYNKMLDEVRSGANLKLKSLPEWNDYIINHYGVMRTGIGEQSGRGFGFAMLSTYGGKLKSRDDCLIFAIPNTTEDRHGDITIPDDFKKISYGKFYDLANEGDE